MIIRTLAWSTCKTSKRALKLWLVLLSCRTLTSCSMVLNQTHGRFQSSKVRTTLNQAQESYSRRLTGQTQLKPSLPWQCPKIWQLLLTRIRMQKLWPNSLVKEWHLSLWVWTIQVHLHIANNAPNMLTKSFLHAVLSLQMLHLTFIRQQILQVRRKNQSR